MTPCVSCHADNDDLQPMIPPAMMILLMILVTLPFLDLGITAVLADDVVYALDSWAFSIAVAQSVLCFFCVVRLSDAGHA